jgi:hypothetical protein
MTCLPARHPAACALPWTLHLCRNPGRRTRAFLESGRMSLSILSTAALPRAAALGSTNSTTA